MVLTEENWKLITFITFTFSLIWNDLETEWKPTFAPLEISRAIRRLTKYVPRNNKSNANIIEMIKYNKQTAELSIRRRVKTFKLVNGNVPFEKKSKHIMICFNNLSD